MQIESLKAFCDLAETESFTQAARINGVTQSAVSQTITALEKHFKALLIERSKKNFRLTPEGQMVYDYSKRILQTYATFQSQLQENQGTVSGHVRVATVYSIGLHELPPYVKRYLKLHPQVNLQVEYRRANRVYEDVLGNVVDLGLVAYPERHPQLESVALRKDNLVLICHPEQPFARLKSVPLRALDGQRFVAFDPDMPTRKALDKIFKHQRVKVQQVLEFDNIETMKRAVEIDSAVAIVPEETVKQEVALNTLAAVPLEGNHCRQLGLIYKKGKVLSPAMKQFIELLKKPLD